MKDSNFVVDVIAPLFFGICGLFGDLYVLIKNPDFNNSTVIVVLLIGSSMFIFGMFSALFGVLKIKGK